MFRNFTHICWIGGFNVFWAFICAGEFKRLLNINWMFDHKLVKKRREL
jgi:hypothetical protein